MGREEVQLHAGHRFRHASFITALGKMYWSMFSGVASVLFLFYELPDGFRTCVFFLWTILWPYKEFYSWCTPEFKCYCHIFLIHIRTKLPLKASSVDDSIIRPNWWFCEDLPACDSVLPPVHYNVTFLMQCLHKRDRMWSFRMYFCGELRADQCHTSYLRPTTQMGIMGFPATLQQQP